MPHSWIRASAIVYLTALSLTSMPITVGLLGWCPCGCMPEALIYPEAGDDDPSQHTSGKEHHHDSQHCRGQAMPYCPLLAEPPQTERVDAGPLIAEIEQQLPCIQVNPLLRPPRA